MPLAPLQRGVGFDDIAAACTVLKCGKVVSAVTFHYLVLETINMYKIQSIRYCIIAIFTLEINGVEIKI